MRYACCIRPISSITSSSCYGRTQGGGVYCVLLAAPVPCLECLNSFVAQESVSVMVLCPSPNVLALYAGAQTLDFFRWMTNKPVTVHILAVRPFHPSCRDVACLHLFLSLFFLMEHLCQSEAICSGLWDLHEFVTSLGRESDTPSSVADM